MTHLSYPTLERWVTDRFQTEDDTHAFGLRRVAEVCDVTISTVERWRRQGLVPIYDADKVACHLGRHPAEIWRREWWVAA